MHQVDKNESLILIATGSLVGEGFDFPRLDTLFMATPVSFRGVVEQYAGRLKDVYKRQAFMYQDKILAQLNAKEHTVHPQAYFHG